MKIRLVYFFPLFFLQIYLILTLVVFNFGPINYKLPSPEIFWSLIISYHLAFLLGYIIAYIVRSQPQAYFGKFEIGIHFKLRLFYIVLLLAIVSSLLSFKGVGSILDLLNPFFWIESAINGVLNPGEAYNEKMERVTSDVTGNKLLNIGLFFIAFSKIILVPFIIFFWSRLSLQIKSLSVFVTLLPVLSSLSHGTNKGVFDFVILYGFSLVIFFLYHKHKFGFYGVGKRKFFFIVMFLTFFGSLTFFGTAMSERGGDLRYIETIDPLNNIKVNDDAVLKSKDDFIYYTYAWLGSYIVQGYYGFSLAVTQDFDTTFGVGNSVFLTRNVEGLLGIELRNKTFQYKIDKWWGESSQWHSFYSFFANDFHFVGVVFVCFLIAFLMAKVWFSFIETGNVFAGAMMAIFAVLIIFIPANNQVFGFLDGLSAFFWTSLLWILSIKKVKFIRWLKGFYV